MSKNGNCNLVELKMMPKRRKFSVPLVPICENVNMV